MHVDEFCDARANALILSAHSGHLSATQLLIERKGRITARFFLCVYLLWSLYSASLNMTDGAFDTALIGAARAGHIDVCQCLLKAKADSTILGSNGKTAWQYAIDNGHQAIAEFFSLR